MMYLTYERCNALLGDIISQAIKGKTIEEQIRELLKMGFTPMELVGCFHFERVDVRNVLVSDSPKITFKSLYDIVDFSDRSIKHIKDFGWDIVVTDQPEKTIRLYQHNVQGTQSFKRLELCFTKEYEVRITSYFADSRKEPIRDKLFDIHTLIRSTRWLVGAFGKYETEWECAEALAWYIKQNQ